MEGYGLVRLERGERGRIAPKVANDRVELDLPPGQVGAHAAGDCRTSKGAAHGDGIAP
jgi:hypothetical protein